LNEESTTVKLKLAHAALESRNAATHIHTGSTGGRRFSGARKLRSSGSMNTASRARIAAFAK